MPKTLDYVHGSDGHEEGSSSVDSRGFYDEATPSNEATEESSSTTSTDKSRHQPLCRIVFNVARFVYSLALLCLSTVILFAAIFTGQTAAAEKGIPNVVTFFILLAFMVLLSVLEGGQGCVIALQWVDELKYADTHPKSFRCTSLACRGDNLERFIVGRQFLVVMIIFLINYVCSSVSVDDASVLGIPRVMNQLFLVNGLALAIFTIVCGQLTAQMNSVCCMLDFINTRFMIVATHISVAIDYSGIFHSVYLARIMFSKISGVSIESNERTPSLRKLIFFNFQAFLSVVVLLFSFAVTLSAMLSNNTTAWESLPSYASIILFVFCMSFAGMMDGIQVALFAVLGMSEDEFLYHSEAQRNRDLIMIESNMQAFLIGRQIVVTICTFLIARITSISRTPEGEDNLFGVSDIIQEILSTGILGAIVATTMASLVWRIIASSFPVMFLSNPVIHSLIRACILFEKRGIGSSSLILARWHKFIASYQHDEVYFRGADEDTIVTTSEYEREIHLCLSFIKTTFSMGVLALSVAVVMAAIITNMTKAEEVGTLPVVIGLLFWFFIIWLAMLEGGQISLVGLQPVLKTLYIDSHPITLKCTTLVHRGNTMEKFIAGRQFLVGLVVFALNYCTSPIDDYEGENVLGLPNWMNAIFYEYGGAAILTTVIIGQLASQVIAAQCMIDFINTRFMLLTTYLSLAIEMSGILHAVYIIQLVFTKISGKPIDSFEEEMSPRTAFQKILFWARAMISFAILGISIVVIGKDIVEGNTVMWENVPAYVSALILLVLITLAGILDGMQIALFAASKMPDNQLEYYPTAQINCELTFRGSNAQAFLIGRQICVTSCMFVIARITSPNIVDGENIFGIPDLLQEIIDTGILGVILTTIAGSLAWRIIASTYPLDFLSNPLINVLIHMCLFLEKSGICTPTWIIAFVQKKISGYKNDEKYIGPEADGGSEFSSDFDVEVMDDSACEGFNVVYNPSR